jgi:hypothetical protein
MTKLSKIIVVPCFLAAADLIGPFSAVVGCGVGYLLLNRVVSSSTFGRWVSENLSFASL